MLTEYEEGIVTHVSFKINTPHGLIPFRMPSRVDGIYNILKDDTSIKRIHRTREQAVRTGWRLIKDWIEAQVAIIEAEMATLEEVMLPYAQTEMSGKTLYERFVEKPQLLLCS